MEEDVRQILLQHGFAELDAGQKRELVVNDGKMRHLDAPWFAYQAKVFKNLYNARMTSDFICWHPDVPEGFVVEVKWQASAGSVDEKYVFTVLSLKALPLHSVLVLEGGGCRAEAIKWIRKQERLDGKRTFRLMTYHGLKKFLERLKDAK